MHRPPMQWFFVSIALSLSNAIAFPHEDLQDLTAEPGGGGDLGTPTITMSDRELERMADYLTDLLREDPWSQSEDPLLYVESPPRSEGEAPLAAPAPEDQDADPVEVRKRSRYYRRYPWKRVSRTRPNYYDSEMFACTPSRHDVLQLLVGLHRAREGEYGRTINFCNRKRPASAVFTNIRFIGKRK